MKAEEEIKTILRMLGQPITKKQEENLIVASKEIDLNSRNGKEEPFQIEKDKEQGDQEEKWNEF